MKTIMLDPIALAENARPISELLKRLNGFKSEKWRKATDRFLRCEDPWIDGVPEERIRPEFLTCIEVCNSGMLVEQDTGHSELKGFQVDSNLNLYHSLPNRSCQIMRGEFVAANVEVTTDSLMNFFLRSGGIVPTPILAKIFLSRGMALSIGQAVQIHKRFVSGQRDLTNSDYIGGIYLCRVKSKNTEESEEVLCGLVLRPGGQARVTWFEESSDPESDYWDTAFGARTIFFAGDDI